MAEVLMSAPRSPEYTTDEAEIMDQFFEIMGDPEWQDPLFQAELYSLFIKQTIDHSVPRSRRRRAKLEVRDERESMWAIARYVSVVRGRVEQLKLLDDASIDRMHERRIENAREFTASDLSLAKVFQYLFTRQAMRQVIDREELEARGLPVVLQECIVDVDMVSNNALEALGLDEYIPPKNLHRHSQNFGRELAIPAVKDMFATGLEPLTLPDEDPSLPENLRFFRLFRVAKGKRKGFIVGTRVEPGKRKILFKTDLHSAMRMFEHVNSNYNEKDIGLFAEAADVIERTLDRLQNNWDEVKAGDELDRLQRNVARIAGGMSKNYELEVKREVQMRVDEAKSFVDSIGRLNKGRTCNLLSTAKRNIGKRLRQCQSVRKHHVENETRLTAASKVESSRVLSFYKTMGATDTFQPILTEDLAAVVKNRDELIVFVEGLQRDLAACKYEPYVTFAKEMVADAGKILRVLGKEEIDELDLERAKHALLKIYSLTRLFHLESGVMDMKSKYLENGHFNHWRAWEMLNLSKPRFAQLREKRLCPDHKISEYNDLYGRAYEFFSGLHAELAKITDGYENPRPEEDEDDGGELKFLTDTALNVERMLREFSLGKLLKEAQEKQAARMDALATEIATQDCQQDLDLTPLFDS
jgi:hypothetical protein